MPAAHNKYRARLNIPPLVWPDTLAKHAKERADYLAGQGMRKPVRSGGHSRPGEGGNLLKAY